MRLAIRPVAGCRQSFLRLSSWLTAPKKRRSMTKGDFLTEQTVYIPAANVLLPHRQDTTHALTSRLRMVTLRLRESEPGRDAVLCGSYKM